MRIEHFSRHQSKALHSSRTLFWFTLSLLGLKPETLTLNSTVCLFSLNLQCIYTGSVHAFPRNQTHNICI